MIILKDNSLKLEDRGPSSLQQSLLLSGTYIFLLVDDFYHVFKELISD